MVIRVDRPAIVCCPKNWRIRQGDPSDLELNSVRHITPKDMLAGRQQEIHAERDRKLEVARKQRQVRRRQAA
jgi:hypothetical protein